jgi:phosphoesterase RecJ-like protein
MSDCSEVIKLILSCNKFLVLSHTHPDGDSIGSQLAFASVLRELGKDVLVANQDPIPDKYLFLSGADCVVTSIPTDYTCDALIVLDTASLKRLGSIVDRLPVKDVVVVNIDHHISNDQFGHIVFVRPERSSTSEIVFELIKAMDVPLTPERAEQLYTGIVTDTGSFRHPNTTFDTFFTGASLVKSGADPSRIASALYSANSVSRMRLLGLVLSSIDVVQDVCCLTLTREMVRLSGASMDESEDFVDFPLSLKGVSVGLLFREQGDGQIRISFRAKQEMDVDEIARVFGGGGHESAAGCVISGELEDVKKKVVDEVIKRLQKGKEQSSQV